MLLISPPPRYFLSFCSFSETVKSCGCYMRLICVQQTHRIHLHENSNSNPPGGYGGAAPQMSADASHRVWWLRLLSYSPSPPLLVPFVYECKRFVGDTTTRGAVAAHSHWPLRSLAFWSSSRRPQPVTLSSSSCTSAQNELFNQGQQLLC